MLPMPVRMPHKPAEKIHPGGLRRDVQECSLLRVGPWLWQALDGEVAAGPVRGDDPAANLFQDDLTRPLLEGVPRAKEKTGGVCVLCEGRIDGCASVGLRGTFGRWSSGRG